MPGFSVKVVDTTGAGDAFVGSLLLSVAKDTSIFDVLSLFLPSFRFSNTFLLFCLNWN